MARGLTIVIDEVGMPLPFRVKGSVRLTPKMRTRDIYELDDLGRHFWSPIAPQADVEVTLDHPQLCGADMDTSTPTGARSPWKMTFVRWDWSRLSTAEVWSFSTMSPERTARIMCSRSRLTGAELHCPSPLQRRILPSTGIWRIGRAMRLDPSLRTPAILTLEDTPFYARSLVRTFRGDEGVHESLDLTRFTRPIVQAMLPFRMPRRR